MDETEHKLLTIYHDMNKMEDEIEQHMKVKDIVSQPLNTEDIVLDPSGSIAYDLEDYMLEDTVDDTDTITDELDAFAKQLHQEQDEFRKKCEYKYAQKVLQQYQDVFDSFIHNYQRILTGNATQQNQQLMSEFKTLSEPINAIIQNLELK